MAPQINKMAPKINKMAPKINEMAPIQCLPQYSPIQPSAAKYSPVQPNIAQYRPAHSSSRVLKWPNLVSKLPVKVPRWPVYHYYGFDCTKLHLLSRDSIVSSIRGQDAILLIFGATFIIACQQMTSNKN